MDKFTGSAQAPNGDLIVSGTPTIRVTLANSDTLATIYSSDSTAATKANPFTLPTNGRIEFHARNGKYRVKMINGAVETPIDEVVLNAGVTYGTLAGRPAAGSADRVYVSSDAGTYYDSGSAWVELPVNLASLRTQAITGGYPMLNGTLVPSVAANALSIAIKTLAGADPSPTDPVYFLFRSATAATGDYTVLALTAATSFTVSSGSTLNALNGVAFRLWVVGFNDGGTFRLGVINCTIVGNNAIYPLGQFPVANSTAEGGIGNADGAGVFYTSAAVTSKAYAVLGYLTYETGLAVAGTWSATPTRTELYHRGVPLPGHLVQRYESRAVSALSGSTTIPNDDTIPQNGEGDEYITRGILPTSAANVLMISSRVCAAITGGSPMAAALFQDANVNALSAVQKNAPTINVIEQMTLDHWMVANATNTTFKLRAGPSTAGTMTINGVSSARKLGSVMVSTLAVEEVMG